MNILNKLKEGHWPIFLLSSMSAMANLFLPIILVRLISPEQMGLYKIFFLYLSMIPFLFLVGGPINSVYYWVGKDKEERMLYIQSCFQLSVLLSIPIILIGLSFGFLFSEYLKMSYEAFIFMIVASFFWVPGGHFGETSIAVGKTARGSIFSTTFEILKVIMFISIAMITKDLETIFKSYTILLFIKFCFTVAWGKKLGYISFNVDWKRVKAVFMYCLPISLAGLLGFFVDKVDLLILSGFLDVDEFAFYSMGCLVIPPLIMLDMSVHKVLIPKISSFYLKNKKQDALEVYNKAISDISFIIVPAIFGLFFFAEPIVELLYTNKYAASATYLRIFSLSYLLYTVPHDAIPRATGKTGWILKIYLITTPISLIGVFLMAKYYGAVAALSIAVALKFLPKIAGLQFSCSIMGWRFRDLFPYKRLAIYFGLSTILTIICLLLKPMFATSLNWFFVCSPAFAIIYLGTLYYNVRGKNE